jgi:hypothetical protein
MCLEDSKYNKGTLQASNAFKTPPNSSNVLDLPPNAPNHLQLAPNGCKHLQMAPSAPPKLQRPPKGANQPSKCVQHLLDLPKPPKVFKLNLTTRVVGP